MFTVQYGARQQARDVMWRTLELEPCIVPDPTLSPTTSLLLAAALSYMQGPPLLRRGSVAGAEGF